MILVDVYVPIMKQTFDVIVDETAQISVVIAELSEIICQRANWPRPKNIQNVVLCSLRTNHILPEDSTLAGMGIVSGNRLMLV